MYINHIFIVEGIIILQQATNFTISFKIFVKNKASH